jgi:hypothetical protein
MKHYSHDVTRHKKKFTGHIKIPQCLKNLSGYIYKFLFTTFEYIERTKYFRKTSLKMLQNIIPFLSLLIYNKVDEK